MAIITVWRGDFAATASLVAEAEAIAARPGPGSHTVEWHLGKVSTKLQISSRLQHQRALPDGTSAGPAA